MYEFLELLILSYIVVFISELTGIIPRNETIFIKVKFIYYTILVLYDCNE